MKHTSHDLPETTAACTNEQSKKSDKQTTLVPIQCQCRALYDIKRVIDPETKVNIIIERAWDTGCVHCVPKSDLELRKGVANVNVRISFLYETRKRVGRLTSAAPPNTASTPAPLRVFGSLVKFVRNCRAPALLSLRLRTAQ